jgi:hypothetical protein
MQKKWYDVNIKEAKENGYKYIEIHWSGIGQGINYCWKRPRKQKNTIKIIRL